MLYNKHNLAVARIAAREANGRKEITGVYFTRDKTAATDRFRLLEITAPAGLKPEDFPQVQGSSAMRGVKPFIVDAKGLKAVKLPSKQASLPILNTFAIKHLDDKRADFIVSDLETAQVHSVRRVEGEFPDYEKLFPAEKPEMELTINGHIFAELLEIISELDNSRQVKIKLYGATRPVVLEVAGVSQKGRALIMPIKE